MILRVSDMKNRNSNIEILRIISVFMILFSHYSVHNGITNSDLPIGINRYLLEISILGNIGVIIFVLISGYFSINKKNPFNIKKIILLVLETVFYSVMFYLIFVLLNKEVFSIKSLLKSLLPITLKHYWFMTAFLLLYIFMPFINKLINSMNREEHGKLIIICLFIFSILRMITTKDYYGNELVQLIYIYIIGAYIGKYKDFVLKHKKENKIMFVISLIILLLSVVIFDLFGTKYPIFGSKSTYLYARTSTVAILFGVSLLIMFISKKEFNNKLINTISSFSLGVYLISDNYYIRQILYTSVIKVKDYISSPYLFLHMIISVLCVFIVCIIIDFIRKNTIEKLAIMLLNKVIKKEVKI